MSIETKCCLTEVFALALFVDMKLLVEKTEKKKLLNSMAFLTSSVALASPKWTVFGIKVVFLDVLYIFIYFELVFKNKITY